MGGRARSLGALALVVAALVAAVIVGAGSAEAQGTTRRIAGADRYKTMEALVREGFDSSEWAVVATAEGFADALAAAPLAGARRAPVILTAGSSLSPEAAALVRELGVRHAYVMGGEGTVTAATEASLASLGIACERVAGADRLQASLAAYDATRVAGSVSDTVVVATGSNYADALAIGTWAWSSASPILLADASGRLSPEAGERIRSDAAVRRILLLGGTAVVSDSVREQLGDAYAYVRLAGADRYATAAEVSRWSCENGLAWSGVALATGTGFADTLAAAPMLGRIKAPLLLASGAATTLVREKASSVATVYVLGGTAAVSDAQERALADALAGKAASTGTASSSTSSSSSGSNRYTGSSSYAAPTYVSGAYLPQPAPQPTPQPTRQPTPQPAPKEVDDGYAGDPEPEAKGTLHLWADEEDVMVPGEGGTPALKASSVEGTGDEALYAQAEEADQAVARTSQTFYVEAPLAAGAPVLYRRAEDGAEVELGTMAAMSAAQVDALNDLYAGNGADDTGDERVVKLDAAAHSYWSLTLGTLPGEEVSVTYVARTGSLASNEAKVDYWLPFTDSELSVMGQVDQAIEGLTGPESFWQQSDEHRRQAALGLIEQLAAKDLIEDGSWHFNEDNDTWSFLYNQDRDETDDDGIMGAIETRIGAFDECYHFDDEHLAADEQMPYATDVPGTEPQASEEGAIGAMSEPLVAQAYSLSRKKALIVNAFPAFEKTPKQVAFRQGFYRQLAQHWRAKGVNTTLWENNIMVGTLCYLNKYDYVVVATHGGPYRYWAGPRNNRKYYEVASLSICQPRNDRYNAKALKDRQLVAVKNGYWVLPKYFRAHYKPGAFTSVILALEACSTFGIDNKLDTELPSAFTQKGATAVAGFLNILDAGYGRNFVKAFGDSLFEGKTAGVAMTVAKNKVGQTQRDWWRRNFKTQYPATYRFDCYPKYVGKANGRLI